MKVLITGHRLAKLENYDKEWILGAILKTVMELNREHGYIRGYAGMAGGVDLWFCRILSDFKLSYVACIPFEEQAATMDANEAAAREKLIEKATEKRKVKNSWMVEQVEMGIVVWDGNKGGTHNVVQQLIEKKKSFIWINPVSQVIWKCYQKTS